MDEKSDTLWFSVIFLAITIIGIALTNFFGWEVFPSDITIYPAVCREKVVSNQCKKPGFVLTKAIFTPLISKQEVLYLDFNNIWQKYTDCTIKDRENWTCKDKVAHEEFGFTEGRYWEQIDPSYFDKIYPFKLSDADKIYYLSRYQWILQRCKNSLICLIKETFNINNYSKPHTITKSDWEIIGEESSPSASSSPSGNIKYPLNLFNNKK